MRKAALEIGKTIYIGAVTSESAPQPCGHQLQPIGIPGCLPELENYPDFFIVHNYYTPFQTNATADIILNTPIPVTQSIMDYVKQSLSAAGLTQKPVALTEWNIFSQGSKQAVSHINGLDANGIGRIVKKQIWDDSKMGFCQWLG